MDWTTIIIAIVSLVGTVGAAGGVLYLIIEKSFDRKGDVNKILRESANELQDLYIKAIEQLQKSHIEEVKKLQNLHKAELYTYKDEIQLLKKKIDKLQKIIERYEDKHLFTLQDIKKKLNEL
jgi:beta-lactamase regulating signal transducer with metallopeptidase domain